MNTEERFPHLPARLAGLGDLAYNLWWSWNSDARELFRSLDLQAYRETQHNPVHILDMLAPETLERAAESPAFVERFDNVMERFRTEVTENRGHLSGVCTPTSPPIVYMSAEFGIHVSLPVYAGGLGILAGDILKESSDLALPMIGLGLLYNQAYVWQRLRDDGWQEDTDQQLDLTHSPMTRMRDSQGNPLRVRLPVFNPPVFVEVWRASVGRVPLYLLSTDVEDNQPWDRAITQRLYTNDLEQRLRQEIVLGMGGVRVLDALGIEPGALHLNDGHPALAILERTHRTMDTGMGFEKALQAVRQRTIFTTHTPVPAGTDVFPFPLFQKYFDHYLQEAGFNRDHVLGLGVNPEDPQGGFNMTVFALRMSRFCNGVSRKHADVARTMWSGIRTSSSNEEGIQAITNGVHLPTWIEPLRLQHLLSEHLGPNWKDAQDDPEVWKRIDNIPDHALWRVHSNRKEALLTQIDARARRAWQSGQAPASTIMGFGALLDPHTLTLGFARRFTSYKRPDLILHDVERLRALLTDPIRPVQIIFSGKAHPADHDGKHFIQKAFRWAKDPSFAGRIAFVENYDQHLAKYLVAGVDVWLNNPLPPQEASGTSGIKASINGVPNASVLDGWWLEGYAGTNGWAIGEHAEGNNRTQADAESLYRLLEEHIVPLYYDQGEDGVPHSFVQVMKAALRTVGPVFNARRMVKEYCERLYKPALDV